MSDEQNKQLVDFAGKLNMDVSFEKMKPEDYSGGLNVQFLTNNTQSTKSHIPMLGNLPALDLGSVAVQNKTYRVYTSQAGVFSFRINAIDQNGNNFSHTIPDIDMSVPVSGGGVTQTSLIQTWINSITLANTVTGSGTTSGYVDITLSDITGYDIVFTITNISSTGFQPYLEIRQEAYDISLIGELRYIESKDLIRDLYMYSTPQTRLPESKQMFVQAITNNGGRFSVQFTGVHSLTTGQKIGLSASGTAIDGIWIITVVNTVTIRLEEYYVNYSAVAGPYPLTITMTTYLEGVGEIGAAVEDVNTSIWTYTRLLRTKEWGFRTKKQIDGRPATRTEDRDSHYFTDGFNVPRCFYYTKPFAADGALAFNGGRYSYGSIAEETKNILSSTTARIEYTSQVQSGGQVQS